MESGKFKESGPKRDWSCRETRANGRETGHPQTLLFSTTWLSLLLSWRKVARSVKPDQTFGYLASEEMGREGH